MSPVPPTPRIASTHNTLRDVALYFLKLGTLGFGGPIALAGYMQRDLVEERGWITPGPVVITVAFIGYLVAGPFGAIAAAAGAAGLLLTMGRSV